MRVSGHLTFDSADEISVEGARVVVSALDVSRTDSDARTLAQYVIRALPHGATTSQPIAFSLELPFQANSSVTLAAHVDLGGSGVRSAGDFVTMQSYPIDPDAGDQRCNVQVRRIT